ncbi:MAG: DoxX family protein [Candidatus Acidiferrales bacterium]
MTNDAEGMQGQPALTPANASKAAVWTGRSISVLVVLFLVFDGVTKLMKVPQVLQASARLHLSVADTVGIGIVLLICTALYAIPRVSILGAILLTGYLGGATSIQLQAHNPLFENSFPVIFGVLVWAGLFLRDVELRAMFPLRARPR